MKLSKILENISFFCENFEEKEILDIAYDSRKSGKDIIFVCLSGAFTDGHKYALDAYDKGSRVFVSQNSLNLPKDALIIKTNNTRAALAKMSCNFFNHPSRDLDVIGITGTKGKTTMAHIIKYIFDAAGIKAGIIGTVGASYGDTVLPTVNTTPESYELQKILRIMADAGCKVVAVEISSLGLKSHRVDGIDFAFGIFTNIYPDHIGTNEHKSFEEYAYWKTQLFPLCKKTIVNIDDPFSENIKENSNGKVITYGYDTNADYFLSESKKVKNNNILSMSFSVHNNINKNERTFIIGLPGEMNCHNSLAAIAIADEYNIDNEKITKGLLDVFIPGRCEIIRESLDITIIIDYAHNGISLKNIINMAKEYEHNRIITLLGSVGGRTECRREELGLVSGSLSDLTIITSDDPDFEDPIKICEEIAFYCNKTGGKNIIIPDRGKAIAHAIKTAENGDIIILAGKGHETYMKINGLKIPFNERDEVLKALNERKEV